MIPRLASALTAAAMGFTMAAPAMAAERVRLPSAADIIRKQLAAEQLLRGGRGPERTLPGRVDDSEDVSVAIDPSGHVSGVVVSQSLRVHGFGDYFFKVPGPVRDVEALPSSSAQPGLRKGSVLWQGFASGNEDLDARLTLVPQLEQERLPLDVSVSVLVDRRPMTGTEAVSGHLSVVIELRNASGSAITAETGSVDPRDAEAALAAVRRKLRAGERPEPGKDGIPVSLPSSSRVREEVIHPIAPLDVGVSIDLPKEARAIATTGKLSGRHISFDALLSRSKPTARLALRADVDDITLPRIIVTARPVAPPAGEAASPASRTGTLDRLVRVLGDVAQLYFVDGYVGNPDKAGPTETKYRWKVVPASDEKPEDSGAPPPSDVHAEPWALALTIAIGLLLVAGAVVAWSLN